MADYFIVSNKTNEILYQGSNQLEAVSHLPEDPSNIRPISIIYLIESKIPAAPDLVRIHYIRNAYRSRLDSSIPSGGDDREIPSKTLELLIDGWKKTRSK